jgi:hypothetical protein
MQGYGPLETFVVEVDGAAMRTVRSNVDRGDVVALTPHGPPFRLNGGPRYGFQHTVEIAGGLAPGTHAVCVVIEHHPYWPVPALAAPDARILIMLRDPIERLRSGIQRERMLADEAGRPFELAHLSEAVYRGLYYDQVRGVLDLYPRESVLVLQFERCRADPLGEMRRRTDMTRLRPTLMRSISPLPRRSSVTKAMPALRAARMDFSVTGRSSTSTVPNHDPARPVP